MLFLLLLLLLLFVVVVDVDVVVVVVVVVGSQTLCILFGFVHAHVCQPVPNLPNSVRGQNNFHFPKLFGQD